MGPGGAPPPPLFLGVPCGAGVFVGLGPPGVAVGPVGVLLGGPAGVLVGGAGVLVGGAGVLVGGAGVLVGGGCCFRVEADVGQLNMSTPNMATTTATMISAGHDDFLDGIALLLLT